MTSDSSTDHFLPKPSHVGHAPKGLLNENSLGSSSLIVNPHSGHEKFSEK